MRARWLPTLLAGLLLACGPTDRAPTDELRIISLSPALTRIVIALGAGDRLVGVDSYSRRIKGAAELPALGALFTPDLERTVELQPTLVLSVASAQQQAFVDQLRARGVRVETFDGHTLDEVLESFRRVGQLVGRPEAGNALSEDVRTSLTNLERPDAPPVSVVVIVERDPLYVVGGGSFVSSLIEAAGGRNAFADLATPYPRVALEALAERAPDVLLDTTHDPADMTEALEQSRAYWSRFPWAGRVEVLPQGILTLPGPDLVDAAQLLQERLFP